MTLQVLFCDLLMSHNIHKIFSVMALQSCNSFGCQYTTELNKRFMYFEDLGFVYPDFRFSFVSHVGT